MSLIDRPLADELEAARSAVNGAGATVGAVLHLVAMREMQRDPNTDFIYRTPGEVGKPHYLARCPCCDTRDALAVTGDRQDDPAGLSCEHCGSNHAELLAALEQVNDGRFKLDVLTARQLCELPDPPTSDELVGPLLVRGARTAIGAQTGEGKTTLGLAFVKAAILGGEFLGFEAGWGAGASDRRGARHKDDQASTPRGRAG